MVRSLVARRTAVFTAVEETSSSVLAATEPAAQTMAATVTLVASYLHGL